MTPIALLRHGGVSCEENFPGCNFSDDEREFLVAIDRYKRTHRRPFPSWREVLHVLRALGWRRVVADPPPANNEKGADPCVPLSS